jgi:hypothetical protein
MDCTFCGYSKQPFDNICPRCQDKGLASSNQTQPLPTQPLPTQPLPTQQSASPVPVAPPPTPAGTTVLPQTPMPMVPGTSVTPAPAPLVISGEQSLVMFLVSVGLYCLGYFLPWASLSFFGMNVGSGGPMGFEFAVFFLALAVGGICLYERTSSAYLPLAQIRFALAAICFIFAAGQLLQFLFLSHIVQVGIGLPLMFLAGLGMVYLSFQKLVEPGKMTLVLVAAIALIVTLSISGYKGYQARQATDFSSLFGGSGPGASGVDNLQPEPRQDVEVKINSTLPTTTLPVSGDFYSPPTAEPGKTYIKCNVTVTFKGTTGTLNVGASSLRIHASNKQIYRSELFLMPLQNYQDIQATLLPGGTTTGDVVFEVEAGAQIEKIEFD